MNNEVEFKDKYGNKVTINELNDGSFRKVTQTNKNSEFEFLGNTYSYTLLNSARLVKSYWERSHSERYLVEDKYGRLFHYRYDEEMNFDGGRDREDILWTLVADEKDSDELSKKSGMFLLRIPFVAADENEWTSAHEYVDKQFMEQLKDTKK
jgi:hypothetical protein